MIHVGDCRLVLPTLTANHFDAIVTDPPYHLTNNGGGPNGKGIDTPFAPARAGASSKGFMGKEWDGGDVAFRPETWAEVLRVAKPGAHLLAFGGTRTFHRLMCAIEDAGWEIRDTLMWVYGSGFPKSRNLDGDWEGWGTALKPAWEPIVLARKPLSEPNVAANAARWGTGALNIDACRVLVEGEERGQVTGKGAIPARHGEAKPRASGVVTQPHEQGRWPANLVHDGSEDVLAAFPHTESGKPSGIKSGGKGNAFGEFAGGIPVTGFGAAGSAARFFYCAKADRNDRNDGCDDFDERPLLWSSGAANPGSFQAEGTKRAAQNNHPTVKPTDLMRWCCRLITPRGGLVLDPFCGSGSTGRGAIAEGFRFEGIELDPEYAAIAEARTRAVQPGLAL